MTTTPTDPPPVEVPTLFGRLFILTGDQGDDEAALLLSVRCPSCRVAHVHTWPGDLTDPPTHRHPHCRERTRTSRPRLSVYLVAPAPTPHNRTVYARYTTAVAERDRRAARALAGRAAAPPIV